MRHYLAYTPGNPGSAHLYPYETTPINAYLCPPTGIINGPPESPTDEEKVNLVKKSVLARFFRLWCLFHFYLDMHLVLQLDAQHKYSENVFIK